MRRLFVLSLTLVGAQIAISAPIAWVANSNLTIHGVNVPTNAEFPGSTTPFLTNSLARTPGGALICADGSGNLWDVTGPPIPVGPTGRTQIGDLDYDNNGLWGFSNASNELFFYDLGLSSVTYSATISLPAAATVTGVAFEIGTGDVYLAANVGLNTDHLLRVANSTTSAVLVGAMTIGDSFSYIADIDFSGGSLYAMTFFHRYFYTVSTSTGATSLVSTGPHRDTTAMALDPEVVPEPATLAALGLGIAAIRRRSRKI